MFTAILPVRVTRCRQSQTPPWPPSVQPAKQPKRELREHAKKREQRPARHPTLNIAVVIPIVKTENQMNSITVKDGAQIYYKDWGARDARPVVFHHGWPLSSVDWDVQMLFFLAHGYRVVAHDRRGHGRSSQVGTGHDMDHYASDASAAASYSKTRFENCIA